ncbi:hypothetical protein [Phytohabitans kaempferiae]|uniref:PRC-barrel domain-containing protein n=1 Tax=Phytohabitans kaempferiae TaxID=1620943 RepID=A0ABV6M2L4_9ACTN
MSPYSESTYSDELVGRALHARDHRPVGRITAVYRYPAELDAPCGAVAVSAGLLRGSYIVDLAQARVVDGVLTVPHDRRTISSAPRFRPLPDNTLSPGDAARVREHYRIAGP